jgi:isocitrate dehydrogenase
MSILQTVRTKVAVAQGDGIGPEIMSATLRILEAAGAPLDWVPVHMGEQVYLNGQSAGIAPEAWDTLRQTGVLLKAPITTPLGSGYKSLNVTLRKSLGLFANLRPARSYAPYVKTLFPKLDIVVIRENEEDLYAGIEHQQTEDVVQCLKLITRPGCEKIIRYAFEYARSRQRQKVTCMTKSNIMKLTDGLFAKVFHEIAPEYPEIKSEHMIIDIGTARLATEPESFDVIVSTNLYGDILSDVVSQLAGSVGMSGSANIGQSFAMFEAIHGSAPDIAGKKIANPSGLLHAAILMLHHLDMPEIAQRINIAWEKCLQEGMHTADIYQEGQSKQLLNTESFAAAVIARLPEPGTITQSGSDQPQYQQIQVPAYERKVRQKVLVGSDVFIDWQGEDPQVIGQALKELAGPGLKLKMITNRGVKVFPNGLPETYCTDHWRCRFVSVEAVIDTPGEPDYRPIDYSQIPALMQKLHAHGWDCVKTENLYFFDGERGFSLGQGE